MELKLENVKSLLKKEISMDEIMQILSASKLKDIFVEYYLDDAENTDFDTVVCEGDLVLDVDFDPYNFGISNLIVKGNLVVPGLMTFYNDPATMIFVGGNLDADNLVAGDTLEVCGNINVKNAMICMEPEPLCIHGHLNTQFFLPADADLRVEGNKNVGKAFVYQHRIVDKDYPYLSDRELYLLLKDQAFTEPVGIEEALNLKEEDWNKHQYFDYVNFQGIIGMLCKRESIYRNE